MAKDPKPTSGEPTATAKPATPREAPKPVQLGGESLIERLLPHIKKILVGTIVLAVVIGGVVLARNCNRAKQERHTDVLVEALGAGRGAAAADQADASKVRAQKILDAADADGAKLGPDVKGSLLIQAGKLDEAIAELGTCTEGAELTNVICREDLAIALEAKALAVKDAAAQKPGLEQALAAFEKMQPAEDGPRRVYALYHQGRLQIRLGKKAEGKALLEKAKTLKPPAELADAIERRLAELDAAG